MTAITDDRSPAVTEAPFFDLSIDRHIAVLRMNRPEQRNTLSAPTVADEMEQLCTKLSADLDVRVAILTGNGPAFSAGGNVKTMLSRHGEKTGPAAAIPARYIQGIQRVTRALARLDVPLVAAVNGPASGAGLDLACMCDIRLASSDATFAESFIRLGLVPGDGGAWFLPRLIGSARAREMAFTGDTIDAQTALRWGLVSEVVAPEMLMEAAQALAARMARNPPYQLRFSKKLFRDAERLGLDDVLEQSALYQALSHRTEDHIEGIEALLAKRPPRFRGL